jgi:hypothetical protein
MGSKVPDSCPMHSFKGVSAPARLQCRAFRVSETFSHTRAPREIGTHSHDASIPAEYGNLQHPRAIISSDHVRNVGRDAHAHYFAYIYHVTHDSHYNHNYPDKVIPRLQRLQSHIKAFERVFNSPTGSGATSGGCARVHPPRTMKNSTNTKSTQLSLSVTP